MSSQATSKPPRVFIVAGEHSGDVHGSLVLKHMKTLCPDLIAEGIGGPLLEKAGMNCLHSLDELAVIGFVEVIRNLGHFLEIFADVKEHLRKTPPDMLILIDYPGFNVRLAEAAKKMGIYVLYFICPQVWAWHASRVRKITKVIDEAVVVFPFEVDIWNKVGTEVSWFGHPLVGIAKTTTSPEIFRKQLEISDGPIISLLPGSRGQEIHYIFPALLDSAEIILREFPFARFLLPVAGTIHDSRVLAHLKGRNLPITMLRGQTYDALAISDLALVASGTATLETAIIGTPMIIVYQTNWFTSVMSKFVIQAPHIGLPNVIAGRQVVPECIRWRFKPEAIARESIAILRSPHRQCQIRRNLRMVKARLGSPGASNRVAEHILKRLQVLTSNEYPKTNS